MFVQMLFLFELTETILNKHKFHKKAAQHHNVITTYTVSFM